MFRQTLKSCLPSEPVYRSSRLVDQRALVLADLQGATSSRKVETAIVEVAALVVSLPSSAAHGCSEPISPISDVRPFAELLVLNSHSHPTSFLRLLCLVISQIRFDRTCHLTSIVFYCHLSNFPIGACDLQVRIQFLCTILKKSDTDGISSSQNVLRCHFP